MAVNKSEGTFSQSFPQYKEGGEVVEPILERSGLLSRKSRIKIPGIDGNKLGQPRTLALRRLRRELVDEARSTSVKLSDERAQEIRSLKRAQALISDPDEKDKIREQIRGIFVEKNAPRKKIVVMGHERDRLAEQFISEQGQVRVDMAELGEQMASYSVLAAPDQQKARQKPPIVFLIGISNDLENMGMLPQEIAYENRNLILVGYPESWNGDVTDAFAKATVEAANYEPHTTFFKKAIEQLKNDQQVKDKIGDFETFDLWGYSAGSVIAAEMLTDQSFGKQVENAALICPTNCIEREKIRDIQLPIVGHQRIHSLSVGLATLVGEQLNNVFRRFKDAPKRNVTNRHDVISNDAMRARKVRTYDAISDKVVRKDPWWERDMQVREGGNITVVSYNQDNMTQSYKGISEIKQNPKLNVIELSGSHQTCLIQPEPLIAAIG